MAGEFVCDECGRKGNYNYHSMCAPICCGNKSMRQTKPPERPTVKIIGVKTCRDLHTGDDVIRTSIEIPKDLWEQDWGKRAKVIAAIEEMHGSIHQIMFEERVIPHTAAVVD